MKYFTMVQIRKFGEVEYRPSSRRHLYQWNISAEMLTSVSFIFQCGGRHYKNRQLTLVCNAHYPRLHGDMPKYLSGPWWNSLTSADLSAMSVALNDGYIWNLSLLNPRSHPICLTDLTNSMVVSVICHMTFILHLIWICDNKFTSLSVCILGSYLISVV